MSELGSNARKQGRHAEALQWYQQAFDSSKGASTRLRWGNSYVSALVDLAPQDSRRIEAAASAVLADAAAQPDAFYQRSGDYLQRMGAKLAKWNAGGKHQAVLDHLEVQLQSTCARLPAAEPQRATCERLLKPAPAKA
jgi:hypothetical protein